MLTEVTDPATGFCLYATSPLMTHGERVIQPTPIVPTVNPKRDAGILPQFDEATKTWYIGTGSNRRAIRTVDMDDSPLPTVPPRGGTRPTKNGVTRAARAMERATGPDQNPNGPTRTPSLPRTLIVAYINGLAKQNGKPAPSKITKDMIRLARLALERQADIEQYCRNED